MCEAVQKLSCGKNLYFSSLLLVNFGSILSVSSYNNNLLDSLLDVWTFCLALGNQHFHFHIVHLVISVVNNNLSQLCTFEIFITFKDHRQLVSLKGFLRFSYFICCCLWSLVLYHMQLYSLF